MGCVYVWTNTTNGKQYVGMSTKPEDRKKSHLSAIRSGKNCYAFHNAVRKYGIEAFTYEEVFQSEDRKELVIREIEEIANRGTFKDPSKGYNQTPGGDGTSELSPEAKTKRAAALKATLALPEVKAKLQASSQKNWADPESSLNSAEYAKKRSEWMKKAHSNRTKTQSWYRAIKDAHCAPEAKRRASIIMREVRAMPGAREHYSRAMRKSKLDRVDAVMCDGLLFPCMSDAEAWFGLGGGTALFRCTNPRPRWSGWFKFPKHNDPECDAVEECYAIMQWAAANPDHPKVPEWARPRLDPELVALEQEVSDMLAERRRGQAGLSEHAAA